MGAKVLFFYHDNKYFKGEHKKKRFYDTLFILLHYLCSGKLLRQG